MRMIIDARSDGNVSSEDDEVLYAALGMYASRNASLKLVLYMRTRKRYRRRT